MEFLWNLQVDALHRNILYCTIHTHLGAFANQTLSRCDEVTIADHEMFGAGTTPFLNLKPASHRLLPALFWKSWPTTLQKSGLLFSGKQGWRLEGLHWLGLHANRVGFGDMAFWTRYQISPSSCSCCGKHTMQCISIDNNTHGFMMSLSCSWVGSWRFGQLHDNFYHQHGRTSSLPAALGVPTGIVCQLLDQSLLHRLPGNCPVPRSWLNLMVLASCVCICISRICTYRHISSYTVLVQNFFQIFHHHHHLQLFDQQKTISDSLKKNMKNPDMKDSSHHQSNMDKWDDIICWDGISQADFSHLARLPNFHWTRQRSSSVCNPTTLKTGWLEDEISFGMAFFQVLC